LELSNLIAVAKFFSVLTGLGFTRNPEFEFKNSKNEAEAVQKVKYFETKLK